MFSCSAELHIVRRVILGASDESHGLALAQLDVPNWRQIFLKVTCSIHYCLHCTFSQFMAECVSVSEELLSVFNQRGPGAVLQCRQQVALNTLWRNSEVFILTGSVCVHVSVWRGVGGVTFHFNTK